MDWSGPVSWVCWSHTPAPIKPEIPMNRPWKLAELKSWLGDIGVLIEEGDSEVDMLDRSRSDEWISFLGGICVWCWFRIFIILLWNSNNNYMKMENRQWRKFYYFLWLFFSVKNRQKSPNHHHHLPVTEYGNKKPVLWIHNMCPHIFQNMMWYFFYHRFHEKACHY